MVLPLPMGEGRGEGEGAVKNPKVQDVGNAERGLPHSRTWRIFAGTLGTQDWSGFFRGLWHSPIMPEKTVNDLPRDLRLLYQRGCEALQRDNFDYAIEMFTQVLNREPS